jgi:hypothetical protein
MSNIKVEKARKYVKLCERMLELLEEEGNRQLISLYQEKLRLGKEDLERLENG